MKVCGIVAEYNPFHRGHLYHIAETRRRTGPDAAIVCAMSGEFVQRGTPAVYGKYARAEAAVRCGADLVAELPLPWAMAPAETFARGALALLRALGADCLSFGSECGDAAVLRETAALLLDPALDAALLPLLREGLPYALSRQRAAEALAGRPLPQLRRPNDILGVEYCKAALRMNWDAEMMTVSRLGGEHDAPTAGPYPSAAYLRALLEAGKGVGPWLAPEAANIFARERTSGRGPVLPAALDAALLSRLRRLTPAELALAPEAGEGLEHRLSRALEEPTLEGAVSAAATKRYPRARLRRCLTAAALDLRAGDAAGDPPYLRVLAASVRGRALLASLRDRAPLPLILRPAQGRDLPGEAGRLYGRCAAAADLWRLGCPAVEQRRGGEDWRETPVMI